MRKWWYCTTVKVDQRLASRNLPSFTVADDVTVDSDDDNDMVVAAVISKTQTNRYVPLHQCKHNITATRNYTDHFETVNACGLQS